MSDHPPVTTSRFATAVKNRPLLGAWLLSSSADNAEALAFAGYDCLIIDHEHGQGDIASAVNQMRAMGERCFSILRVPTCDKYLIKRALDASVDALLVPNVRTEEEAEYVAKAVEYGPVGKRGVFSGMRATKYGIDLTYHQDARQRHFVMIQIESLEAIANLDKMLGVQGIDGYFIGPRDLSADVGAMNDFDHPKLRAHIDVIEDKILGAGKFLGSISRNAEETIRMIKKGYSLIISNSDMGLLTSAAKNYLNTVSKTIAV